MSCLSEIKKEIKKNVDYEVTETTCEKYINSPHVLMVISRHVIQCVGIDVLNEMKPSDVYDQIKWSGIVAELFDKKNKYIAKSVNKELLAYYVLLVLAKIKKTSNERKRYKRKDKANFKIE